MIPVVINNPEAMLKVRLMTLIDESEETLKLLQTTGVLHIEESKELKPTDKDAIERQRREVSELLSFINRILSYVPPKEPISLGEDVEVVYTRPFSQISDEVKSLYAKISRLYEKTVKIEDEVSALKSLKSYLEPIAQQNDLRLKDLRFSGDYLFSRVFVVPTVDYEQLADKLKDYVPGSTIAKVENETVVWTIAQVKNQRMVESLVIGASGRVLDIPEQDVTLGNFIGDTAGRAVELEEELNKLRAELQSQVRGDIKRIVLFQEVLAAENDRLGALEKAAESKYLTLIEGWVPVRDEEAMTETVKSKLYDIFLETRKPGPNEEPPVKMKNKGLIKPFETVTKIFEIPKYRGWDPTPVVAYSFAFFFGLMMSDVINGLFLLAIIKWVLPKFVDDPSTEGAKQFLRLMYVCAGSAIFFGVLNGSYMGDVHKAFLGLPDIALVPAIGRIMGNPISFVVAAIVIGLIHINTAHILALIKGIKEKNVGVILNRSGLFSLELGLPVMISFLLKIKFGFIPERVYRILPYFIIIGVILFIVSNIKMNGLIGSFLWIFDITGFFGDVISYSRLAGVGLAGFYLGSSFNLLVKLFGDMFSGVFGAIFGFAIGIGLFLIGHSLNIFLGAMGCFVHSLRLCFVEFLTKFYEGGGREYSPFKLKKRTTALVAAKMQ